MYNKSRLSNSISVMTIIIIAPHEKEFIGSEFIPIKKKKKVGLAWFGIQMGFFFALPLHSSTSCQALNHGRWSGGYYYTGMYRHTVLVAIRCESPSKVPTFQGQIWTNVCMLCSTIITEMPHMLVAELNETNEQMFPCSQNVCSWFSDSSGIISIR